MASEIALDLEVFPVPEPMRDLVTTIYRLEVDLPVGETVSDWLLPEWGNLRFIETSTDARGELDGIKLGDGGFFATGPTSRALNFTLGKSRLWGFGLLPLGWATFVRASARELINAAHDAANNPAFAHFGSLVDSLGAIGRDDWKQYRAICSALAEHAVPPRDEARIRAVQKAMVDPYLLHIPDFAERANVSVRTLERICLKHFGFSPNVILRRQRLIRSLASYMNDSEASWSEAMDRHYHDQPHFVREFHHFMDMSPTEYSESEHPIMRAFMTNRQHVWGNSVRQSGSGEAIAQP